MRSNDNGPKLIGSAKNKTPELKKNLQSLDIEKWTILGRDSMPNVCVNSHFVRKLLSTPTDT